MKRAINRLLRRFNCEVHGVGYLNKLAKGDFNRDLFQLQQDLVDQDGGCVIFDAGANRGQTAAKYRNLLPAATIHCFEPTPNVFSTLKEQFTEDEKVRLNSFALSDAEGTETLNVNSSADTNSLLQSTTISASSDVMCRTVDSVSVKCRTVDNYCNERDISRINILKMDVQGSELKILQGGSSMISGDAIDVVYTEAYFKPQYVDQPLLFDLHAFLHQNGFELVDIGNPYYNARQILWCDALFARSDLLT